VRIAIVGNGPSAAGKGAEIDGHDMVIRMTTFPVCGALDAGRKINVYAWFGIPCILDILGGPRDQAP
jgi:hypothetical protein